MNISIYNGYVNDKNYISSIEIKDYKQLKRIVKKLKDIKANLNKLDRIHNKIRYYTFKVNNNIILSENNLDSWNIKH